MNFTGCLILATLATTAAVGRPPHSNYRIRMRNPRTDSVFTTSRSTTYSADAFYFTMLPFHNANARMSTSFDYTNSVTGPQHFNGSLQLFAGSTLSPNLSYYYEHGRLGGWYLGFRLSITFTPLPKQVPGDHTTWSVTVGRNIALPHDFVLRFSLDAGRNSLFMPTEQYISANKGDIQAFGHFFPYVTHGKHTYYHRYVRVGYHESNWVLMPMLELTHSFNQRSRLVFGVGYIYPFGMQNHLMLQGATSLKVDLNNPSAGFQSSLGNQSPFAYDGVFMRIGIQILVNRKGH